MASFLQTKVADLINKLHAQANGPISDILLLIFGTLTSICKWFLLVESAGRYLSGSEADSIYQTSQQLLA